MKKGDKVTMSPESIENEQTRFKVGIGEIVEDHISQPDFLKEGEVDVRWPKGRYLHLTTELVLYDDNIKPV